MNAAKALKEYDRAVRQRDKARSHLSELNRVVIIKWNDYQRAKSYEPIPHETVDETNDPDWHNGEYITDAMRDE